MEKEELQTSEARVPTKANANGMGKKIEGKGMGSEGRGKGDLEENR